MAIPGPFMLIPVLKTLLAWRASKKKRATALSRFSCGVDGTRTHYLLIANQMLYQMSYYPLQKKATVESQLLGGVYRSRTDDLLHAMQAL